MLVLKVETTQCALCRIAKLCKMCNHWPLNFKILIKAHGSVSCDQRSPGHAQTGVSIEYINRNNKLAIFTHP